MKGATPPCLSLRAGCCFRVPASTVFQYGVQGSYARAGVQFSATVPSGTTRAGWS